MKLNMTVIRLTLILSLPLMVFNSALLGAEPAGSLEVTTSAVVLEKVPVSEIRVRALNGAGVFDPAATGEVHIEGIRVLPETPVNWILEDGELVIRSRISEGVRVYVESSEILAELVDGRSGRLDVRIVNRWFSLVPPLIAIVLAVVLKNVYIALLVAVWGGVTVVHGGNLWSAFLRTLDTYLPRELTEPGGDGAHMQIIFFTLFLGAMIGVMSRSGGTHALVARMTHFTKRREHGQVLTWFLGLVVFFDDYANTMLVGSTMRSVSDRLRISRQKLAFLVDATAAPVAGIAVVSTWVGFEVSQIETSYRNLGVSTEGVYTVFLETIPYRFYPLLLLGFTGMIAWTGRDFGPMLRAEQRTLSGLDDDLQNESPSSGELDSVTDRPLMRNALIPLAGLLVCIAVGMYFNPEDSVPVLLVSSFIGSALAIVQAIYSGSLSLDVATNAWLEGARGMFIGVVILVLSWSIGTLCNESHLNTAGFIVDAVGNSLSASWMPALSFSISALVAFATGSSFATMGLLIPLFVSITFFLLGADAAAFNSDSTALATIGAVLAGAIFGDHCSPISDTTVLSSMSAGCDHLGHVGTQLPYALLVGGVSLGCGYLPAGFGISPLFTLPLGFVILAVVLVVFGRRPEADPV